MTISFPTTAGADTVTMVGTAAETDLAGTYSLTDPANEAVLTALPSGNGFKLSYNYDPTAAHCAGDFGLAVVTNQSLWDY